MSDCMRLHPASLSDGVVACSVVGTNPKTKMEGQLLNPPFFSRVRTEVDRDVNNLELRLDQRRFAQIQVGRESHGQKQMNDRCPPEGPRNKGCPGRE